MTTTKTCNSPSPFVGARARWRVEQCAKHPVCLGLNTERPVHRTGPALFMPWSDAPGLSANTLVFRAGGQGDGSPQWGPLFMNTPDGQPAANNAGVHEHTHFSIRIIFTDRPGYVGAVHQHLNNTPRQLPSTGRSMVGRCSTAKADFGLLIPNFPLCMNKQRRLLCALGSTRARGDATWAEAHVSPRCLVGLVVFWRLGRLGRC